MKRIKFTESQIVKAIKEHESGKNVHDLCRELGISTAAFYKWRQRYGGMEVKELSKFKGAGRRKCTFKEDVCES